MDSVQKNSQDHQPVDAALFDEVIRLRKEIKRMKSMPVHSLTDVGSSESKSIHQDVHNKIHMATPAIGSHEVILASLIPSLLREENMVPEGMIFDVGAQHGEQGAHYAVTSPGRQVLAMDPSPRNVKGIQQEFGNLPNFRVEQGGVGKEVGTMKPRDKSFAMNMEEEFKIFTLDSLFFDKQERLGLLHLDVEGLELDVLKGGLQTIRLYKPIMTTEVRVHQDPKYTVELLNLLDKEGYDSYVISEVCGYPHLDYRNLLNIPRELSAAFGKSDTINLLFASEAITRVESSGGEYVSIFEVVLPCCALGGECCPGNDIMAQHCCSEALVMDWAKKNNSMRPSSMIGWKSARIWFEKWHWRLLQRQKLKR